MNRKHLIVLLGLAAVLSLTACGTEDKKTEPQTKAAAENQTDDTADGASAENKTDDAANDADAENTSDDTADDADAENTSDDTADDADAENTSDDTADDADIEPAPASDEDEILELEGTDETENGEELSATEAEPSLAPVTPSDYLVKDIDQYVTLGDVNGLEVTRYIYDITDDMIDESIQYELDMYSEEISVDRAAQAEDIVYLDLTSSIQGSDEEPYTESTYFTVGYEEYGTEFDEKLLGAKTGDQLSFSITFDDDIWVEEWIGQTVDFTADVTAVCEISIPEYNEEFVAEYTDFETMDEYEASIRESLTAEYDEISYTDAVDALLEAAVAQSEIISYPQELYDACKAEVLSFYASFAGTTDEDEIYSMFGITEDDLRSDIEYYVYRRLLVSAICEKKSLDLTQDEYFTYLEESAPYYDYESAADFEADYTRETLIWSLYESKAADFLYSSAKITEEAYTEDFSEEDEVYEDETEEADTEA